MGFASKSLHAGGGPAKGWRRGERRGRGGGEEGRSEAMTRNEL